MGAEGHLGASRMIGPAGDMRSSSTSPHSGLRDLRQAAQHSSPCSHISTGSAPSHGCFQRSDPHVRPRLSQPPLLSL